MHLGTEKNRIKHWFSLYINVSEKLIDISVVSKKKSMRLLSSFFGEQWTHGVLCIFFVLIHCSHSLSVPTCTIFGCQDLLSWFDMSLRIFCDRSWASSSSFCIMSETVFFICSMANWIFWIVSHIFCLFSSRVLIIFFSSFGSSSYIIKCIILIHIMHFHIALLSFERIFCGNDYKHIHTVNYHQYFYVFVYVKLQSF